MPKIVIRTLLSYRGIIIPISEEEVKTIRKHVALLKTVMSEIDYCVMLRDNILDAFLDLSINAVGQLDNFNRLNRYLMNWLNSFYAWIEFHERNYHDLFDQLKRTYYDTSFEYRFAYEMRKYTTHQAVCISQIKYDALNEKTKFEIPIDEILLHGTELKRAFRDELANIRQENPSVDVKDFTQSFYKMFESFQGKIWSKLIPESDAYLQSLFMHINAFGEDNVIAFRIEDTDGKSLNIGNTIIRYLEKKKSIPIPAELQPYT